eukprot:6026695-Prymnesium_polylepis.1
MARPREFVSWPVRERVKRNVCESHGSCVARASPLRARDKVSELPRQSSYLREDNPSLLFGCEDNYSLDPPLRSQANHR